MTRVFSRSTFVPVNFFISTASGMRHKNFKAMKMNRMTKVAGLLAIILLAPAIMASCKKEEPVINVTSVGLNNSELTLNAGESETLKAFVSPTAATNKDVTWTSSDPSVATVDNGGKVTALKIGFTNIKATTVDGGKTAVSDLVVTTGGKRVTVEAGENMLKAGSQGI
ncbi:MAG: Ig-like domain-containing protein, partial [Bacteroidetes bacterium]|nr:Ig-like domain-containing protein [Bacteroidota bacterium]